MQIVHYKVFFKILNSYRTALFVILFIFSHFISLSAQNSKSTTVVELTKEEKAWLKAHPNITLGYTADLEPDVIRNADGTYSGMVVDFLSLLNQKLGTNIKLSVSPIPEVLDNAQKKNIDGIINIHPEYSDSLGLVSTNSYWPAYLAVFARKGVSFEKLEDFAGKRVAVIKGVYVTQKHIEHIKDKINIIEVDNALEGLQKVQKGDVDYFFGLSYNSFFIPKYHLFDVVTAHVFMDKPVWFGVGLRADYPELVSILNKGIALISETEIHVIISKWSYLPKLVESTELSKEEKAWISENHTIRVSFWKHPPLFYLKDGKVVGIAVDLLNTISENTGLSFQYENRLDPFADVLKGLKDHNGPDVVGALMPTADREKSILFTRSYFNSPRFIFTRDDAPFVSSIENLKGKNIAVVKDYVIHQTLVEKYPDIDLLIFHDNEEALRAVSMGQAFAFIGDLVATPAMINEFGLKNIKAACPSGLPDHPLAMGIRNDWPELHNIIDKALDAMPAYEKTAIINKWDSVQFDYGISPHDVKKWILIIGGSVLFIIILIIFWNRSLKLKIAERTAEIIEKESRFRRLVEQTPMGIEIHDLEGKIVQANPAFASMHNLEGEALNQVLTHFNLRTDEQAEALGLKPYIERVYAGEDVIFPPYKYSTDEATKSVGHETVPHELWAQVRGFPLKNTNGQVINAVFFVEDITEQREGEALLEESEKRFRATFEQAAVGIAHVSPEGSFVRINQKFCAIVGYTQQEMLKVTFQDITHPDDLELDLDNVNKLLEGELETYSMEKRYFHKNGSIIWINLTASLLRTSAGEPDYFIAVIEEITDKKATESQLRESEEKFRAVVDQSPIAIQIHGLDGKLISSNAAWRELNAFDDEVLAEVKEKYSILEDEQARELGIMPSIKKVYAGESVAFPLYSYTVFDTLEKLDFAKSVPMPRTRWIQTQGFPLKDEAGRVTSAVFMSEDITEQKLAEMALQESEEKFRSLMEQSPLSLIICDKEGRTVDVNKAWLNLWNLTEEDLPAVKENYNLLHDAGAAKLGMLPLIEKAFKGETIMLPEIEYESVGAMETMGLSNEKAKSIWLKGQLYPVKDEEGNIKNIISIAEDITERKQADEKLKEKEEELKGNEAILSALMENSLDLIAYRDMKHCLVMFNEAFTQLVWDVFAIKAVPGLRTMDTQGEAFKDHWEGILKKVVEGEPYHDEFNWESKTGEMQYFEIAIRRIVKDGKVIGTAEFTRNITERKQADMALQESEERFRSLMEQSPLSIQICNKDGRIEEVNKAWMNLWNITEEDLPTIKEDYSLLKDTEVIKRGVMPLIEKAFTGETVHLPDFFYKSAGVMDSIGLAKEKAKAVWLRITLYPVLDEAGDVKNIISIEEDITESKLAEEKLKQSEKDFRDLVEQNPLYIQTYSPEGNLINLNKSYADLLNLSKEMELLLYKSYNIFRDPQAAEQGLEPGLKKVFDGETFHFQEYELDVERGQKALGMNPKGPSKIWLKTTGFPIKDENGAIKQVVFLSEDITERKKSVETRDRLFNLSKDLIGIGTLDGYFIELNPIWESTLGYSIDELLGMPFMDLIHPDDREKTAEEMKKLNTGQDTINFINRYMHKDGASRYFSWSATPIPEENLMFCIAHDVTKTKEVEKEILQYQKRLKAQAIELTLTEERQRKQIATDLHDHVGQILASNRMQIAAMTDKMPKAELFGGIQKVSKGLLNALKTTRSLIFDLSPPQLNEIGLYAATADWIEEELEEKYGIKTKTSHEGDIVVQDNNLRILLFRCIRELLINIIKHAKASKVEVSFSNQYNNLTIRVQDNGVGFNFQPEMLRLKNTGFGLFSVIERVENMGGSVKVESKPNDGTAISIIVPLK